MQRRNAPRARRPVQGHGNFGSNMSDRQGALLSRPSPFVNDVSPFGGDNRGSFGDTRGSFAEDRSFGNDRSFAIERPFGNDRAFGNERAFGNGGNDRAFGNDRPAPFASSEGNLHLQELDLELALLKRKREIIEQQQQLLSNNDSYRPQKNGPPSLMQNFSNLYNDPPAPAKRRGDGPWEGSYPKRFNDSRDRRSPPRAQIRPAYDRPKPVFTRPADKPRPRPRPEPRAAPAPVPVPRPSRPRSKNFNPTKVTKPKETVKPLSAYPAPQRKFLARQAVGLVQETEEDFLLTADKPATPRMIGRLELALGVVFKDVHKLHLDKDQPPLPVAVLRAVKQTIRDRIREVMVGKVVGKCADTVNAYRAKYPADTDKAILETAEAKYAAARKIKYIDAEHPAKYFKENISRLLKSKLTEMIEKLKGLHNKEELKESIEKTLEEMKEADAVKFAEAEAKAKAENDAATSDSTDVKVENGESKETEEEKESADKKDDDDEKRPSYRTKFYEKLMEDLIKSQLPDILPPFKGKILSLFDIDEEYNKTKAAIIMKTEEIASRIENEIKSLEDPEAKVALKVVKQKATAVKRDEPRTALFFVKVLGRPVLPKRHLMQGFLDQFHPRAIKRHRTMKNMLFIGFQDKADFDKMLKANKTVIDNCTLDIRVSDRTKQPSKDAKKAENSTDNDTTVLDDSTATVEKELDSELDNQIDDLLTSIRQEEEKNEEPDEEVIEITEKADEVAEPIENADKTENWEDGDGNWNENTEGTWEDGDGDVEMVAADKPEENGSGDAVEESKADETVTEVVDTDDGKDETQSTDTANKITTRRSTRTKVAK